MARTDQIRKKRLQSDHREMINMRGAILQWKALRGAEPYVEEYELTVNVRSVVGPEPTYRNQHKVKIILPPNYPLSQPEIHSLTKPHPYHPNWYPSGPWCSGDSWNMTEGLGQLVLRMIRVLQFDPAVTNEHSPTNRQQKDWYVKHKNTDLIPCDQQKLPDPSTSSIEWTPPPSTKRIRFH